MTRIFSRLFRRPLRVFTLRPLRVFTPRPLRVFTLRRTRLLASVDAYAHWAGSYPPHAHNPLMQAEEAALTALLPDMAGWTVLDLACGTGRYGIIAAQRGAGRVLGLDNSPAMLRASTLPAQALATSAALPLADASVDLVLWGLAVGHLPQAAPSMRELGRVLKPGGWALVSDVHPFIALQGALRTFTAQDGSTYAVEHYVHLYSDMLRAAQAAGLLIDYVEEPRLAGDAAGKPIVIIYRLRKSP